MAEIIGRDESVGKEQACRGCGSLVLYFINDIESDYSADYAGGKSRYKFIRCPSCNHKMKLTA